jgi:hypothetical protein
MLSRALPHGTPLTPVGRPSGRLRGEWAKEAVQTFAESLECGRNRKRGAATGRNGETAATDFTDIHGYDKRMNQVRMPNAGDPLNAQAG